jgi:hypothetical protein
MRLLYISLLAQAAHASPYVDPTAIEADAPEMLQPSDFYTFCGPNDFVLSLDPAKPQRPNAPPVGEEVKHALDEQGGTKVVSCALGTHELVATFDIAPPSERGWCAAVHHIKVRVRIDDQMLLSTKFAEYCTHWGITSLTLFGSGGRSPSTLRVCGYWQGEVPLSREGKGLSKRSFECADFDAIEMVERKLYIVDTPHEVHALAP